MFKVLLVDDEEEVRSGIRNHINWAKLNFEVIGEAENGREALAYFDECIPDIVLTDINMPFMDGLELTEEIRQSYPTVKVVILTGFDDFKFAQTAIKYGVSDYILKPVLPDDINKLLESLNNKLILEINEKEDIEKLRMHYIKSLPVLKENYLVSMILGKTGSGGIDDKMKELNIHIGGNWFASAILKIDSESIAGIELQSDIDLKKLAVFSIVKEVIKQHESGEAFTHDDGIVILLGVECNDRTTARNKMFSVLDEIRQSACKFLRITVSIGLGRILSNLNGIRESYLSSMTARNYKLILSGNKVIFVEDLEPGINSFFHLESDKEETLVASIKFKGEIEVSEIVDRLFSDLIESGASLKEHQLYFMEIIASLMKLARLFQIDASDVIPDKSGMYMQLDQFNSIDHAKSWIRDLSLNLMKGITGKRLDATQVLFEKAKHYIIDNYGDPELNVQKLSDYLFISPSYLSLIFKKESGETFLKYLMRIRLGKARELLFSDKLKISEVAEKVGYPDVSYFSYFFKKNTGQSPREYRKTIEIRRINEGN